MLRPAGNNARYARAPDGTEALIIATLDRPAWLTIVGPDGASAPSAIWRRCCRRAVW